ncbi:MAG: helix-turn-helix transcriptional regulator [Lachnospiraceae bacterium]|nr:helix-turn-helix transcriptional regulator [Lachnospiraceae bacterium]
MEPMYVSIRLPETGNHIKQLLKTNGYTVKDVQSAMGFENPQAIYKWMSGKSLPSLDNLVILSKILHSSMEDILVVDGDVVFYTGFRREGDERGWCRIFHEREQSFLAYPS